jgi:hypothetical protein
MKAVLLVLALVAVAFAYSPRLVEVKKGYVQMKPQVMPVKERYTNKKAVVQLSDLEKDITKLIKSTRIVCRLPSPSKFNLKQIIADKKEIARIQSDARFFKKFLKSAGGFLKNLGKQALASAKEGAMGYIQTAIA